MYNKIFKINFYLYLIFKNNYSKIKLSNAGVAELADALDLGSSGKTVQVQVLSPAPPLPTKIFVFLKTFFFAKLVKSVR